MDANVRSKELQVAQKRITELVRLNFLPIAT